MKTVFIVLGLLIALCVFFFSPILSTQSTSANPLSYPELALSERPGWAQWRSEGKGVVKFFLNIFFYQKKSNEMVLNPFPGQKKFFSEQKNFLASLPQPIKNQVFVKIGFVGDLMAVLNTHERFIAPQILTMLQSMDFVLGNLETPISQSGAISKFRNTLSQFNVPDTYLDALVTNKRSVFQFLSLSNNHILDRGDIGVQETKNNVEAKGILVHGAGQQKFTVYSTKGINFGVATATWGVNPQLFQGKERTHLWYLKGIAPLDKAKIDLAQLKDTLAAMKNASVDFKILYLHWGFEFESFPDPMIQEVGRELIRSGADLIIGSHSHMLQPYELVQTKTHKGLIAYSMGNFITSMVHPFNRIGLIQELKVWRNPNHKMEWSLGASRLTQVVDRSNPQTVFLGSKPEKNLVAASEYYKHSLNAPFLQ